MARQKIKHKGRFTIRLTDNLTERLIERVAYERTDVGDTTTFNTVVLRALDAYLVEIPK